MPERRLDEAECRRGLLSYGKPGLSMEVPQVGIGEQRLSVGDKAMYCTVIPVGETPASDSVFPAVMGGKMIYEDSLAHSNERNQILLNTCVWDKNQLFIEPKVGA